MLDIEIDGQAVQVQEGSTVIEAAQRLGKYIPHFCYHKKLSIAANCRMCLVQVEKAPKPMPACATPVTNGMKVFTHSDLAVKAQKGVMEFLLINHPLDCPICDQGGECQLQDLSVGYGASAARYQEPKRVVMNKNLGALIATDMTRCINCTRCVRFSQEIAGFMELGQAFRGDRAEIMAFVESTVDSELSGNMIDICPVGALTSKPFRFAARTWELSRRKSIAPHDSLGSNIVVQTKLDRVLRVLPLENEAINECWLSDRDRYSYEAVNSPQRLTKPMVKQGGKWQEVEWSQALDYAAHALQDVARHHGGPSLGALVSPQATLEEMYLAQKLMRGLNCENIDFRLRQTDFSADGARTGIPWLGMKVSEINELDRILLIGSFLRDEQPLLAQRLRYAVKHGAQLNVIHSSDEDLLVGITGKYIVKPSALVDALTAVRDGVLGGSALLGNIDTIVASLRSGKNVGIFLGNFAQRHPQAAHLHVLAQEIAAQLNARLGVFGEGANNVGGHVANAMPSVGALNAHTMLRQPRRAWLLVGVEPDLDCFDAPAALAALRQADTVVALTAFSSPGLLNCADVLLPISPWTETSGTFINCEGRVQSFQAVAKPLGETRPGWKVLRVLGNLAQVSGFNFQSGEEVRNAVLGGVAAEFVSGLDNTLVSTFKPGAASVHQVTRAPSAAQLERVADIPPYALDALVRRAPSLQKTRAAAPPAARMNAATLHQHGLLASAPVRVVSAAGAQTLTATQDDRLPDGAVRISGAHPDSLALGPLFADLTLEKV